MKAVGIRVLKAKLSEYVRLVKAGETILVTERDEVVAELRPARRQPRTPDGLAEHLEFLAERREARLRSDVPGTWRGPSAKVEGLGTTSQALLDALREDRGS
jgi:antitoxin (DNA-binding transcriptional repressor) of toxin-antitoxin stability system